ncbi:MAG: putative dehydrogenase [Acidimicrobiales bacterium]|jgi:predicted dehydrogenase
MLRIGFLGCGLIARSHPSSLANVAAATIVAAHDIDANRASQFATTFGGVAVASAEDVISACDAVYICTWTSTHPELVALACEAGRAVFCEKPLAIDYPAAAAMTAQHSIHDLDLLTWMMGPIKTVSAVTANVHGLPGIEDAASVLAAPSSSKMPSTNRVPSRTKTKRLSSLP